MHGRGRVALAVGQACRTPAMEAKAGPRNEVSSAPRKRHPQGMDGKQMSILIFKGKRRNIPQTS